MDDFFKFDELTLGTKGLVYIGEKVLIYRRDDKTPKFPLVLDVPGGKNEPDETPFETFAREVKEEFGLIITKDDISYVRRYPSVYEDGRFAWFAVAKLPATQEKNVTFGDEGLRYQLMNIDDYMNANDAWELYQERTRDYLQFVNDGDFGTE